MVAVLVGAVEIISGPCSGTVIRLVTAVCEAPAARFGRCATLAWLDPSAAAGIFAGVAVASAEPATVAVLPGGLVTVRRILLLVVANTGLRALAGETRLLAAAAASVPPALTWASGAVALASPSWMPLSGVVGGASTTPCGCGGVKYIALPAPASAPAPRPAPGPASAPKWRPRRLPIAVPVPGPLLLPPTTACAVTSAARMVAAAPVGLPASDDA